MSKVRDAELIPVWVERPDVFELEPLHVQERFRDAVEEARDGLFPGVRFGSSAAYELARDAEGIDFTDFEGVVGSGEDGKILKADVEKLLDEAVDDEEDSLGEEE